jgi:signal peptide peptidase SppA
MRFAHLAQALFNRPLLLHPAKAEMLMAVLAQRLGVLDLTHVARANGEVVALEAPDFEGEERAERKPYSVVHGVAIIEISGTLVHKLGSLQPYCGMTGYDGVRACFLDAVHDPAVRGICLSIDSPGGDVAGCFDLADTIASARGRKPIHAILDESAYSAAYAIASAADRISVPRTGGVGSIGVIAMVVDLTKFLDREGVKVNVITFGAHKAEGQPFLELAPEARARFQDDIDTTGNLFVATVARNRKLSPAAVRATEAATFQGLAGVRAGLADGVASPDAAFRTLLSSL